MAYSSFAVYNSLEFFFSNICNLKLVESVDVEAPDLESQLYVVFRIVDEIKIF